MFQGARGTVAHLGRFVAARHRAILVPSEPRKDLRALAATAGHAFVWPEGKGYGCTDPELRAALVEGARSS
ncbi:hypothetical protein ACSMX9_16210 [Streptomyces sp. LE64]|uniref:hypothetical protein n=1 Tax=Streptomyces sp. LE64 TaxID=3448653 RepID=UPI004041F4A6